MFKAGIEIRQLGWKLNPFLSIVAKCCRCLISDFHSVKRRSLFDNSDTLTWWFNAVPLLAQASMYLVQWFKFYFPDSSYLFEHKFFLPAALATE